MISQKIESFFESSNNLAHQCTAHFRGLYMTAKSPRDLSRRTRCVGNSVRILDLFLDEGIFVRGLKQAKAKYRDPSPTLSQCIFGIDVDQIRIVILPLSAANGEEPQYFSRCATVYTIG